jgi:pimeloyl-ACP methyl ester carboxylesterase
MKIFYIHGANASPRSFSFLSNLVKHDCDFADYTSSNGFFNNLKQMKDQISIGDWFIVSHSLGGIYSAHLSVFLGNRLKGAVSLSTPYGGSEISDVMIFVHPFTRLFRDTGTMSKPIVEAQNIMKCNAHKNWTAIVTTSGRVPYLPGQNDGVVSVESQLALDDFMDVVHIDCNHYEILQATDAADIIQSKLPVVSRRKVSEVSYS